MINYIELIQRTQQAQPGIKQRRVWYEDELDRAVKAFLEPASPITELPDLVTEYTRSIPSARLSTVAVPLHEGLNNLFPPPAEVKPATVMAVDASQLLPRPYSSGRFAILNAACVTYPSQSSAMASMRTTITTRPIFDGEAGENWAQTVESIPIQRDLLEKTWMAETALTEMGNGQPVIALLDGGLELYSGRAQTIGSLDKMVQQCVMAYEQLAEARITYAGYIGAAQATMLIHLIEVASVGRAGLRSLGEGRLYPHLTDGDLLSRLLLPGHRSPVYRIAGRSTSLFSGSLALHVCYINTSLIADNPVISRVEIPRWIAEDPVQMTLLHAHILHQCSLWRMSFPAVLILADSACHITPPDASAVEALFRGNPGPLPPGAIRPASAKAQAKRTMRRKRGGGG